MGKSLCGEFEQMFFQNFRNVIFKNSDAACVVIGSVLPL
jgi:hypothetical protein